MSPVEAVARCEKVMAHAWMVRTFVKHSTEVEDFPELMGIVRSVFDTSRALETRVSDPAAYLHMLRKKIGKLRQATNEFSKDAPLASTHTNFQQAVISMNACVQELDDILRSGTPPVVTATESNQNSFEQNELGETGFTRESDDP